MTGHGQASVQNDQVRVVAEIRSVNNRFLKTNINCDLDAAHQSKLETLVKKYVNRGSLNLRLKTHFLDGVEEYTRALKRWELESRISFLWICCALFPSPRRRGPGSARAP